MKRKRQSNSPKSSQKSPPYRTGNASLSPNKKSVFFKQTHDSQQLASQLLQLLGSIQEDYIKRNPLTFITLLKNFSPEIIVPAITISNSFQELNLGDDVTYNVKRQIGCLKPELLPDIYAVFHNHALTSTSEENFTPHFTGGLTKARKVIWIRGINLLTYTFEHLMEELFPYYDDPFKILAEHFCDGDGNDFTPEQLRKNHSKGVQKESKQDMIHKAFLPIIKKGDAK